VSNGEVPTLVLDTNVLLDLWLFDDPSVRALRAAIEGGRLRPLRSADCEAEFAQVIGREHFGLDEATRRQLHSRWMQCSEPIANVAPAPFACTDPDDQKFLDAAFTAGADWLLTRDKALLKLARRAQVAGLRIASPAAVMTYDRSRQ
jgi:predicted nucleic acid-binding protein